MPMYEYKCEKCEKVFVAKHSMEERKEVCSEVNPTCDLDEKVVRQLGTPVIDTESGKSKGEAPSSDKNAKRKVEKHIEEAKQDLDKQRKTKKRMEIDISDLKGVK